MGQQLFDSRKVCGALPVDRERCGQSFKLWQTIPRKTNRGGVEMTYYTIWVGGLEVNRYYLKTRAEAEDIAQIWRNIGHDDVAIEEVEIA